MDQCVGRACDLVIGALCCFWKLALAGLFAIGATGCAGPSGSFLYWKISASQRSGNSGNCRSNQSSRDLGISWADPICDTSLHGRGTDTGVVGGVVERSIELVLATPFAILGGRQYGDVTGLRIRL
jgi:hypothetical protein